MMKRKLSVILLALSIALTFGVGQAMASVSVSTGTIGDVLMFSLYDVRDDDLRTTAWDNFLVIENTSGNWTACHLRFRAYKKSIEVWDHVILLSPYDMFWLDIVRDAATGKVKIWSNDYNTLQNSGLTYSPTEPFVDYLSTDLMVDCGYPDDAVETQHGEIEVIGLWSLEIPDDGDEDPATLPNGDEDVHVLSEVVRNVYEGYKVDGVTKEGYAINVYDVMYALFYEFTGNYYDPLLNHIDHWWDAGWETYDDDQVLINTNEAPDMDFGNTREALDCGNILTGAFEMGDIGNGRYELQNFVVLRDFRTDDSDSGTTDFHRDQYGGGEIVFPPTVMSSNIETATYTNKFSGVFDTPLAYYLNESWSSTVGPGLRDGDDNKGDNAGGDVQYFNDIYSLDDVENALGKDNLWFHYFNDCFDFGYDTIVSMSFPTKHYHWFFCEPDLWAGGATVNGNWPWWEDTLSVNDPQGYLTRITNLRKNIEYYFDFEYNNGEIKADSRIWNDDEVLFESKDGASGSPNSWNQVIIPHEVNSITVGECGGILSLCNPIDALAGVEFDLGHFNIHNIRLMNGMRGFHFDDGHHDMYKSGSGTPYPMYPVGGIVFLNYTDTFSIVRSCLTNWHYVPDYPLGYH
jgi:hypothetical protein